MPRGDRTGPTGMGPRSGRAAGYCTGYDAPGFMNRFFGRGLGRGAGLGFGQDWGGAGRKSGFGWRNMFWSTGLPGWMRFGSYFSTPPKPDPDSEKKVLENQVEFLKMQLDQLQNRLNELESTASDK